MIDLLNLWTSFLLGLATPLTAVCVLPLYPAFISFLANKTGQTPSKKTYALLGTLVLAGVITFMLLFGLLFTTLLRESLTNIIGIVTPVAFAILALISLTLIFNLELTTLIPKIKKFIGKGNLTFHSLRNRPRGKTQFSKTEISNDQRGTSKTTQLVIKTPTSNNPKIAAYLYGLFFGAIVLPCNPAFIAAFLTRTALITDPINSILNFLTFGIGLGAPLALFSIISSEWSGQIIRYLTRNKKIINLISGLIMLGISLYYLIFVFRIFG